MAVDWATRGNIRGPRGPRVVETVRSVSANTTAAANEMILVDATTAPVTVAPPSSPTVGDFVTVRKVDPGPNHVTWSGPTDGDPSAVIVTPTGATFVWVGDKWTVSAVSAAYSGVPAEGGGGGGSPSGGARVKPAVRVGDWIMGEASQIGTLARPNAELQVGWLWLDAGTYDRAAFQIDTPGSTGATLRLVVYADNEGRPGATLADVGAIAATSGGIRTVTGLSIVVPEGGAGVWAGVVAQSGPSQVPSYWSSTRTALPTVMQGTSYPALFYANTIPTWMATGVSGAAPAGSSLTQRADGFVRLMFRRSD